MKKAVLFVTLSAIFILALGTLSAQASTVLEGFEISPNPMDKFTVITLSFNTPADIGVNIENRQGQVIKNLYWGPADEYIQIIWNRYDDNGQYTPSGEYLVVVSYQSRYTSTKKTVILK
ncbi:MAG: hypothetical protein K0B87_06795 [Candidatus Syntrophosphaera sp.]|nr:hypothetical protein [Candidatus Syntrophosphaera sp.]